MQWLAKLEGVAQTEIGLTDLIQDNREISINCTGTRVICEILLPAYGRAVHLKGYGWIKMFRTVGTNGDMEYWVISKLEMSI